jgi:hypothetical protein
VGAEINELFAMRRERTVTAGRSVLSQLRSRWTGFAEFAPKAVGLPRWTAERLLGLLVVPSIHAGVLN